MGKVVFTEKCCSGCGALNWDSQSGSYGNTHEVKGKTVPCDTNGEVRKWDENNNRVY